MTNKIHLPGYLLILVLLTLAFSAPAQNKQGKQSVQKKSSQPAKKKTGQDTGPSFQNNTVISFTPEQIETFRQQCTQIVKFFEGTLNFLADKSNLVKEKQTIINESFLKSFWDSKVQVEDDLDENRLVPLYKDIQAYLTDVGFFFKRARFTYTVQDVAVMSTESGQTYFKVTANRNLTALTVNNDSVNSNKVRYFEINYDDKDQSLKIVSIYTTKLNENEDMKRWWNELPEEWKMVFGKEYLVGDTVRLSQVGSFQDSVAIVNGESLPVDGGRIYQLLVKIIESKSLDIHDNIHIRDLLPLSKLSYLVSLDLSGTSVTDLMPLSNLNDLQVLNISRTGVTSLEPLKYAGHIRVLKLADTKVTDISVVSGFGLLEELDISGTGVTRLDPVRELVQMKDLRLLKTGISDLSPVSGLTNIEVIDFSGTGVSDLADLGKMNQLQVVIFNDTKVGDLGPLESLPRLQRIYCDNTLITRAKAFQFMQMHPETVVVFESADLSKWWDSLSPEWKKVMALAMHIGDPPTIEQLHRLVTIDSVNVRGRPEITSLAPVAVLTRLRILDCSSTGVDSFEPLRDHAEMTFISAYGTKVSDVTPLTGLVKLDYLNIENTQVRSIMPLENLKNLKFIYADNSGVRLEEANRFLDANPGCLVIFQTFENENWWNPLPVPWKKALLGQLDLDVKPDKIILQRIANLEKVIVRNEMQITYLQPVVKLSRLKELEISDTRVSSLEPIAGMTGLKILRFPKNPVVDLNPVSGLTGLKELDCSNTQVDDLEPIAGLTGLEVLKLAGTQVKNLKDLEKLVHLKELEIYNTRISNVDELELMPDLKLLKAFNTKISSKKIDKFRLSHPRCEVVYY